MDSIFQHRVSTWMHETFAPEIINDKLERALRFFEEATELCQSIGMTTEQAHKMVDYTMSRPVGLPEEEVGGVMVTLAALSNTMGISIEAEADYEINRISTPEMIKKIRAKQVSKSVFGIAAQKTGNDIREGE